MTPSFAMRASGAVLAGLTLMSLLSGCIGQRPSTQADYEFAVEMATAPPGARPGGRIPYVRTMTQRPEIGNSLIIRITASEDICVGGVKVAKGETKDLTVEVTSNGDPRSTKATAASAPVQTTVQRESPLIGKPTAVFSSHVRVVSEFVLNVHFRGVEIQIPVTPPDARGGCPGG